jgi:anti-sigma B factor antagonist
LEEKAMLTISKTVENGKAILASEGRLDTVTAPELENVVKALLPEITELTFDFGKLEYISSAGLRVLLFAQKAMNAQEKKMSVVNVNETVMDIFEVTGFSDILNIA